MPTAAGAEDCRYSDTTRVWRRARGAGDSTESNRTAGRSDKLFDPGAKGLARPKTIASAVCRAELSPEIPEAVVLGIQACR